MKEICFNADVGEEAGFDKKLMPFLSMCNIACGVHAGNEKVIRNTIDLALEHEVKIGAHPSYPDRVNFGRISMNLSEEDLIQEISDQVGTLKYWTEKAGAVLHHVKPHGALYNDACVKSDIAISILTSVKSIDKSLKIVAPKISKISYISDANSEILNEVFADRMYNNDLTLVSRLEKNAVLLDPKKVLKHVLKMVVDHVVVTSGGVEVPVFFDTICVHGDNPKSLQILGYLYKELKRLNFEMK